MKRKRYRNLISFLIAGSIAMMSVNPVYSEEVSDEKSGGYSL